MAGKKDTAVLNKQSYGLLALLALAVVLLMPTHTTLEHHFLYFPVPDHEATPAGVGLTYQEVEFFATDGIRLNGWLVPGDPGAPIVLFCMGNAGNISHRLETLQLLHELGVATFIFNYRGYGKSDGKASESGTYQDVAGALDFINKAGWEQNRIILFGRSLGAAVSLEAALRTPTAGLIMESAFTSIPAMGKHHYPLINLVLGWILDARYDNLGKIARLESPLLLIHGEKDSICPPVMAKQLYGQAPEDKQIHWIPGADHNDGFMVGAKAYRQVLRDAILRWTCYSKGAPEITPRDDSK